MALGDLLFCFQILPQLYQMRCPIQLMNDLPGATLVMRTCSSTLTLLLVVSSTDFVIQLLWVSRHHAWEEKLQCVSLIRSSAVIWHQTE